MEDIWQAGLVLEELMGDFGPGFLLFGWFERTWDSVCVKREGEGLGGNQLIYMVVYMVV